MLSKDNPHAAARNNRKSSSLDHEVLLEEAGEEWILFKIDMTNIAGEEVTTA